MLSERKGSSQDDELSHYILCIYFLDDQKSWNRVFFFWEDWTVRGSRLFVGSIGLSFKERWDMTLYTFHSALWVKDSYRL